MEAPFPFEAILAFGAMSVMLLIGIFLRAKVRFFQRFLFPSCLIGGILGWLLISLKVINVSTDILETFAYHFFIISFISVGLTYDDTPQEPGATRKILGGAWWMAMIEGITVPIQLLIGSAIVGIFLLFGKELFPTFGFLVPIGFTEGPGQALAFGKVWETDFGFEHAATIGLTFAAVGYLFAFFAGVPLVNWGIRRGLSSTTSGTLPDDVIKGIVPRDQEKESAGQLTLHSGNVDTLAFHAALIGLVYVLTYFFVKMLAALIGPQAGPISWGFCFFYGMFIALILRTIMKKLGIRHLINPGVQRRITGWSVDFLIVATVMAIQAVVVWEYILPISLMCIFSWVATLWSILYLGRRLDRLGFERAVAIYGTCTGTVSTGLLLLRIADPEFKSPVAFELALMNVMAIPFIATYMVLMNAPLWWHWSLGFTCLIYFGFMVLCLVMIKLFRFWGKPKF